MILLKIDMTESKLSNKLKNLRIKMNMSQDRFGKKIGVTGKTISAYECGRCVPPLKILEKVSKLYGTIFIASDQDKYAELTRKILMLKDLLTTIEDELK